MWKLFYCNCVKFWLKSKETCLIYRSKNKCKNILEMNNLNEIVFNDYFFLYQIQIMELK